MAAYTDAPVRHGWLRFLEAEDRYSLYEDADGNELHIAHGPGRRVLVESIEELDLSSLWSEWQVSINKSRFFSRTSAFWDWIADKLLDPGEVEDYFSCDDCSAPEHEDNGWDTGAGNRICDDCRQRHYACCVDCDNLEPYDNLRSTLHDESVCESCIENCYGFCEECDGYYHYDSSDGHDHGGCNCEAPAQQFRIRNDGQPMLANDTPVTVSLPAGVISDEGLGAIAQAIRNHAYTDFHASWHAADPDERDSIRDDRSRWNTVSCHLDAIGSAWQTKQGNFTKRLSRYAYKEHGLKVPPALMSEIGNIARAHSVGVDFDIEVTRNLNLPAEEFAHESSCWWQSYSGSRCCLKNNGGFGIRTFSEGRYGRLVEGRAWVIPLKFDAEEAGSPRAFSPTFNTESPDAFIVFNGYGNLEGYTPARLLAHMAGMTYRKTNFCGYGMYVNGESGYLVAPEEIATHYTDGSVRIDLDEHSTLYHDEHKELSYA